MIDDPRIERAVPEPHERRVGLLGAAGAELLRVRRKARVVALAGEEGDRGGD